MQLNHKDPLYRLKTLDASTDFFGQPDMEKLANKCCLVPNTLGIGNAY